MGITCIYNNAELHMIIGSMTTKTIRVKFVVVTKRRGRGEENHIISRTNISYLGHIPILYIGYIYRNEGVVLE